MTFFSSTCGVLCGGRSGALSEAAGTLVRMDRDKGRGMDGGVGRGMGEDAGEELLRGRVYGQDHDDPRPGPRPGRVYAELVGGPLDGLLLDVTDWTERERAAGAVLETELGRFGAEGRSLYDPRRGDARRFDWSGDAP